MSGKTPLNQLAVALMVTGLAACGGDSSSSGSNNTDSGNELPEGVTVPDTYSFETRLDGQSGSSVAYPGQTARLVLIKDLDAEIGNRLEAKIGSPWDSNTPKSEIRDDLERYYQGGTTQLAGAGTDIQVPSPTFPVAPGDTPKLQTKYSDLSSDKNLAGKIAGEDRKTGQDSLTAHRNWRDGDFVGWNIGSPDLLVNEWFDGLVTNVKEELTDEPSRDNVSVGPGNNVNLKVFETREGVNYQQLVEKFLYGAVTMSQGMDDYLDDDVDGKGLLTDNKSADGSAAYTPLEHQFDEAFGYFGAARDLKAYTKEEIAGEGGRASWQNGYHDSFDPIGSIDLESEINLLHAPNAASRDLGSQSGAKTDFTGKTFEAFLNGRAIINNAVGRDLNEEEMAALKAQRNVIVENWEKAMGATVIHYINATLGDMEKFGNGYDFHDHAVHWGEMKGYGLTMQFNPRSPLLEDNNGNDTEDFQELHNLMGEAPVLPKASQQEIDDYEKALLEARDLLKQAYGFADENVENW